MSKINVGKVSPVPKGNWGGANAAYEKLNMVNYNGVLYIAKQDIVANSNIAITNTNYWMKATNNWSIGTVNTINDSTASASASVSEGSSTNLINLTIPRGAFDTEIIDDNAGSGDTTHIWSANKSAVSLKETTGMEIITGWVLNKYINTSGSTVDMDSPSSSLTGFAYAIVQCQEGDKFTINGTGASSARLWAFVDSSSNVLSKANASVTASNLVLTAPENAAYLILNNSDRAVNSYKGLYSESFCKNDNLTSYNTLAECVKSGWYTGTVTDVSNFSDKPTDFPTTGGCHLEIRRNSFGHSNFIMQLLYATTGECWYRLINTSSVVVDWTKIIKLDQYEGFKYVNRISIESNTLLSECRNSGWYIDSSDKMKLMVDKPSDFTNTGGQLEVKTHSYGTYSSNYITQKLFDTKGNCWFRLLNDNGSVNIDWLKIQSPILNYSKLYVSILGDSISTYKDYIPSENAVYYTGSNYGVTSVNKMWWKIAIDNIGGIPLIIDAWSGSCVSSGVRNDTTEQSNVSRCKRLHAYVLSDSSDYDLIVSAENIDEIRTSPFLEAYTPEIGDYVKRIDPDVIFCTGGGNDYSYNCPLGSWDGHTDLDTNETTTFREAYANMLNRIQNEYPKALVICFIPPFLVRPGLTVHDENQVNRNSIGNTYHDYHKIIREIAELFGCPVVDMFANGFNRKNYYNTFCSDSSTSPTHPNALGQSIIGNNIYKQLQNICNGYIDYLKS